MDDKPLLNAALHYASLGWRVHPLRPREKRPLLNDWPKRATTDEKIIRDWWRRWPRANVGIATGRASGILVLDVDGAMGRASLTALEERFGKLPHTPTAKTPNGLHLYFRIPPGVHIRNSAGQLGAGLDIRSEGGYVVAPPSVHPNGQYVWQDGGVGELAEIPANIPLQKRRRELPDRIPVGQRNTTLASIAGGLRRRGLSEEAIYAALLAENERRCDPPLPAEEVRRIAQSIARYPSPQPQNLTDLGNAERLIARHGADLRYCTAWGRWLYWDEMRWRVDDTGEVDRRAVDTIRALYAEAGDIEDSTERKHTARWALASEADYRRRAMVRTAAVLLPVRTSELDCNPWLLTVLNGTIDLATGELRAHRRDDMIAKLAPVVYDPEAIAPTWEAFLDRVFAGDAPLIDFIQRAIGYSLTGDTREQVLFLLYGTGANGKTTFLETLRLLFGDYAMRTPTETLMLKRADHIPADVARLCGARLVAAVEADEGQRLAESLVKQLTGGDTVVARRLYGDYFEFKPQFKLWLAANHKPTIRGQDRAIWRRIRLVPFTVTIPEEEQDVGLLGKLTSELPGILAWAVRGCLAWQRCGLDTPAVVQQATADYRREQDALALWLDEACICAPQASARGGALYQSYANWCAANGEQAMSHVRFARRLADLGFDKRRDIHGPVYVGIGLISE